MFSPGDAPRQSPRRVANPLHRGQGAPNRLSPAAISPDWRTSTATALTPHSAIQRKAAALTSSGQGHEMLSTLFDGARPLAIDEERSLLLLTVTLGTLLTLVVFRTSGVYGENELGGLGRMYVLTAPAAAYGLPESPQYPALVNIWQNVLQPFGYLATGLMAVGLGFNWLAARRARLSSVEHD